MARSCVTLIARSVEGSNQWFGGSLIIDQPLVPGI